MRTRRTRPGLKRLTAIALVIAMLLTVMPASAWAAPAAEPAPEAPAAEPEAPVEEPVEEPAAEQPAPEPEAPAEEPAPEAPAEEPAAFAAELNVDDLTVSIDAEAGAFPEGVAVTAEKADLAGVQKAVDDAEGVSGQVLCAVDITFTLNGEELQPAEGKTVKVSFSAPELKAAEDAAVVHIDSETQEAEQVATVAAEDADVAFEAEKFSVYAVVTDEQTHQVDSRLKIIFHQPEGDPIVIYFKEGDDPDEVIYDPGLPYKEGCVFRGWTEDEDYTTEDQNDGLVIADVRDLAEQLVESNIENQELNLYPMLYKAFRLYFENEDGFVFETDAILIPDGETSADVVLDTNYVALEEGYGFVGWAVKGTTEPIYKNGGDPITISADTVLVPVIRPGKWLIFNENDGGTGGHADYTPPIFVEGGLLNASLKPDDPTRPGYTFDAWYTGAPAEDGQDPTGSALTFTEELTEDTTVYAKWTPNPIASYKVIVWAQKVTDDKDAQDAEKTYDYVKSVVVEDVLPGTVIDETFIQSFTNYGNEDFGVTDLANGSTAFKYRTYVIDNGIGADHNGVSPANDTVVHVYYDRELFTLRFVDSSASGHYYVPVDSITGTTAYGLVGGEYVPLTTEVDKYIEWYRSTTITNTTRVGELSTFYYSPRSNQYTAVDSSSVNLTNAAVGTTYKYYDSSSNVLTNSTQKVMYRQNNNQNRIYAVVRARNDRYTYNGETYTGQIYAQKDGAMIEYTGLYGQTLAQNGCSWPEGSWKNIAFLDSFNGSLFGDSSLGSTPNLIDTNPSTDTTDIVTIIFYQQDADNTSSYAEVGRARYKIESEKRFRITQRIIGSEPSGYAWSSSGTQPTSWRSTEVMNSTTDGISSDGFTNVRRQSSDSYLHIKYDRKLNDIVFLNGNEEVTTISDVPFGKNLSGYASEAPESIDTEDGYYFVGWYEDPECTYPVVWNTTMPESNKTVYAKILPVRYHFVADPNGGTVPNGQSLSFRVDYRETVDATNFMNATLDEGHTLIGWFKDEAGTQPWSFDTQINDDALSVAYSGPDDPLRAQYADDTPSRLDVVGLVFIYAQWRDVAIEEAGGIKVVYEYEKADGTTGVINDDLRYADGAEVYARHAPSASEIPEGYRFKAWQIVLPDGSLDGTYYPAQTFYSYSRLAKQIGSDLVITLRAVYVPVEQETTTHITFYKNDGTADEYLKKENLQINEAVDVPVPDNTVYPGYEFLGWARFNQGEYDPTATTRTLLDADDLWLELNADGQTFTLHETGKTNTAVTQVAADEEQPYHDLFAVWEQRDTFTVVYSSDMDTAYTFYCDEVPEINLVAGTAGLTDVEGSAATLGVTDGMLYAGYYTAAPVNGKWDVASAGTADGRTLAPQPDTTYYVKEVDASYLSGYCTYSYVGTANAYKNQCTSMVFLSSIDDLNYSGVGFVLNKDDQLTNKTSGVKKSLKFKPAGKTAVTMNASNTFNHAGYLTYLDVGTILDFAGLISESTDENDELTVTFSSANFQLYPYWVTLDGVPVVGTGSDVVIHVLENGVVIKPANRANITDGVPANVMAVLEPAGN